MVLGKTGRYDSAMAKTGRYDPKDVEEGRLGAAPRPTVVP
jgi:hypothetical protein